MDKAILFIDTYTSQVTIRKTKLAIGQITSKNELENYYIKQMNMCHVLDFLVMVLLQRFVEALQNQIYLYQEE